MENNFKNLFDNSFWILLHTLTFNYPNNPTIDIKKKYFIFFKNIGNIIPCSLCSNSYNNIVKKSNGEIKKKNEIDEKNKSSNKITDVIYISPPEPESMNYSPEPYLVHDINELNEDYIDNIDYLKSKENLSNWLMNYHNKINKRLNKKEYSYEEVKEYYENIIRNSDMLKDKYNNENN
jgi:hypothetical protein